VLLAAPGRGGDALSELAAKNYPFFSSTDFSEMTTPTLVVAGDNDDSRHLTVRGPDWHADPYHLSPGPKSLFTLYGAEHGLGGISGYDVAETTDGKPGDVHLQGGQSFDVGRWRTGGSHARRTSARSVIDG